MSFRGFYCTFILHWAASVSLASISIDITDRKGFTAFDPSVCRAAFKVLGEYGSFVEAIYSEPHDDAVRLIFADWLEEKDMKPRAEMIRVQVRLAQILEALRGELPNGAKKTLNEERAQLQKKQSQLLAKHYKEWISDKLAYPGSRHVFRRGFLEEIHIFNSQLVTLASAKRHFLETFEQIPTLAFLHYYRENLRDDPGIRQIMRSPYVQALKHFASHANYRFNKATLDAHQVASFTRQLGDQTFSLRFQKKGKSYVFSFQREGQNSGYETGLVLGVFRKDGTVKKVFSGRQGQVVRIGTDKMEQGDYVRVVGALDY